MPARPRLPSIVRASCPGSWFWQAERAVREVPFDDAISSDFLRVGPFKQLPRAASSSSGIHRAVAHSDHPECGLVGSASPCEPAPIGCLRHALARLCRCARRSALALRYRALMYSTQCAKTPRLRPNPPYRCSCAVRSSCWNRAFHNSISAKTHRKSQLIRTLLSTIAPAVVRHAARADGRGRCAAKYVRPPPPNRPLEADIRANKCSRLNRRNSRPRRVFSRLKRIKTAGRRHGRNQIS